MDKFITRKVVSTPQPKKSSNPDSSPPTKRKRGDGDASTDSDKSNVVDITVPSEPSCSSKGLETQQKTAKKDERGFSPHWFFNMKTGEKKALARVQKRRDVLQCVSAVFYKKNRNDDSLLCWHKK